MLSGESLPHNGCRRRPKESDVPIVGQFERALSREQRMSLLSARSWTLHRTSPCGAKLATAVTGLKSCDCTCSAWRCHRLSGCARFCGVNVSRHGKERRYAPP
jgi:hypothetical protein